jgi:hypothetical protein
MMLSGAPPHLQVFGFAFPLANLSTSRTPDMLLAPRSQGREAKPREHEG